MTWFVFNERTGSESKRIQNKDPVTSISDLFRVENPFVKPYCFLVSCNFFLKYLLSVLFPFLTRSQTKNFKKLSQKRRIFGVYRKYI